MRLIPTRVPAAAGVLILATLLLGLRCMAENLPLRLAEGSTEILLRRKPIDESIEIHALFPQGTKVRLANSPKAYSVILEIKASTPKKKRVNRTIPIEGGGILKAVRVEPGASILKISFELLSLSIPRYTWWRTKSGLTMVLPALSVEETRSASDAEPDIPVVEPAEESAPPEPTRAPTRADIDDEIGRILGRTGIEEKDGSSFSAVDYWREHAGTITDSLEETGGDEQASAPEEPADAFPEPPARGTVESIRFELAGGGKLGILKIRVDGRPRFAVEKLSPKSYRILLSGVSLAQGAGKLQKAPKNFKGLRSVSARGKSGSVEVVVEVAPDTKLTASAVGNEVWVGAAR